VEHATDEDALAVEAIEDLMFAAGQAARLLAEIGTNHSQLGVIGQASERRFRSNR